MGMTIEVPKVSDTAKLSAKDAAEALGVAKRTVLNYITTGQLRATLNKKNQYRISGRDLIRFWNQF